MKEHKPDLSYFVFFAKLFKKIVKKFVDFGKDKTNWLSQNRRFERLKLPIFTYFEGLAKQQTCQTDKRINRQKDTLSFEKKVC